MKVLQSLDEPLHFSWKQRKNLGKFSSRKLHMQQKTTSIPNLIYPKLITSSTLASFYQYPILPTFITKLTATILYSTRPITPSERTSNDSKTSQNSFSYCPVAERPSKTQNIQKIRSNWQECFSKFQVNKVLFAIDQQEEAPGQRALVEQCIPTESSIFLQSVLLSLGVFKLKKKSCIYSASHWACSVHKPTSLLVKFCCSSSYA